jgi:hypothetical protein
MTIQSTRYISSGIDGNLPPTTIGDGETCIIFSNDCRIALIKLLGSMSRDGYAEKGLSEPEAVGLSRLYYTLQH